MELPLNAASQNIGALDGEPGCASARPGRNRLGSESLVRLNARRKARYASDPSYRLAERERKKVWRDANREKHREICRKANRKRRSKPEGQINGRIAARIWECLKQAKPARTHWESLVGYSIADLRRHLERQFLPGMAWSNIGEWHIDHVLPLSFFKFTSPSDADFRAAWSLPNLRPLWALDNVRKGPTRTLLL